jgi:NADH dehydrogenase
VPPITADQVELMRHDNVVRPGAISGRLGIEPTAAEAILPTYLDRFRVGGRYNQHARPEAQNFHPSGKPPLPIP